MASFANLTARLNLNISNFSNQLRTASNQVNNFANNMNGNVARPMNLLNRATTQWGLNLNSAMRIITGIAISQTFYTILRDVRAATDAVWEFTKQLEYAQIAYSNLFGDTALATEFINVLKDFAAKTPFTFTEAEKAAKRLLAYGIEYKNIMYVMQGVASAAAAQGDSSKIEPISRALGQIFTYGKLMTAEVRQLTEAGIPVYDILQEKLGLTQEQLRNLGNEAIPASAAINALIDGINERFGNVFAASSKTITGIISNIKDNALMLASGAIEPITVAIKSGLSSFGEYLFKLREIFELKGLGGVFEAIFPPELHGIMRQFIANIAEIIATTLRFWYAIKGLLRPVLEGLIMTFNAVVPVINLINNVLNTLIYRLTNNASAMKALTAAIAAASAMWVLFKATAIAASVVTAVVSGISRALAFLSTVLTFVVAHPFWSLLIGLTAVVIGLTGGFENLGQKISGFFSQLTKLSTIDPDKILLPSQKDRANDLDKFNKKLDTTADSMDDLADSTGKATKAAKNLLSFDEVFRLKEPDEGTDSGVDYSDLADTLAGIGNLGSSYVPEVPDFSEYVNALKDSFIVSFRDAWNSIKEKLEPIMSEAIGAGIGAIVGRIAGGPIGAAIGAVAGAIVGYFWDKLAEYFSLTPEQEADAAIIAGIGTGLGAIIGAVFGGAGGARLGAIIGGLVGTFWGMFAESLGVVNEQHISTAFNGIKNFFVQVFAKIGSYLSKNLIPTYIDDAFAGFARNAGFSIKEMLAGSLKQGLIGALVGLGGGILSNALSAWIADELNLTEDDLVNAGIGQSIVGTVGSIAGLLLGGPGGALVGGVIGQLLGSVVGEFWDSMNATLKGTAIGGIAGVPTGAIVGLLVGSVGGPLGAALGAVIGAALGALIGLIVDYWEPISEFFVNLWNDISDFFTETWDKITTKWDEIKTKISNTLSAIWDKVTTTWDNIKTKVSDVLDSVWTKVTDTWDSIKTKISGVLDNIWTKVTDTWDSIKTKISGVLDSIWTKVTDVWDSIKTKISDVCSDIWEDVSFIWYDIRDAVVRVTTDIWDSVTRIWNDIKDSVSRIGQDLSDAVTRVWNDIRDSVSEALGTIWETVYNIWSFIRDLTVKVLSELWEKISKFFTDLYTKVADWVTDIYNKVAQFLTDVFNNVTQFFIDLYNTVTEWVTETYNKVAQFFTDIYSTIKDAVLKAYEYVKEKFIAIYDTITEWLTKAYEKVKKFFTDIYNSIRDKVLAAFNYVKEKFMAIYNTIAEWVTKAYEKVSEFFTNIYTSIRDKVLAALSYIKEKFKEIYDTIKDWIVKAYNEVTDYFSDMYNDVTTSISDMYESIKEGVANIYDTFTGWISDLWYNVFGKFFGWINDGISKLREFFGLNSQASSVNIPDTSGSKGPGHATGGIFDREHIARFAEGNKAEAVIPLENNAAMQPFVDAISRGIIEGLAPTLISSNSPVNQQSMPPLYVGTLIADDRGLKQLYKKFELIQVQENARRGLA